MFLVYILGIVFASYEVESACVGGYTLLGEYCYAVLHVKASWAEAQHYCKSAGGSLAIILDAQEEALIDGMLRKVSDPNIQAGQFWIGGMDLLQEGNWVAPVTLEPLTYFNWAPGEPDNLNGQHCLSIFRNNQLQWDDNTCEVKNYALCKAENGQQGLIG